MHSGSLIILHQGAIGDFLLALSLVQAVRGELRIHRVIAIASAPSARLAAGRSAIDECLSPEDVGAHCLFGDGPLDQRLQGFLSDAELVLSFLSGPGDPVHARLDASSPGRIISVDPFPNPETFATRRHVTRQWAEDVRRAGLAIPEPGAAVIRREVRERTLAPANESGRVGIAPAIGVREGILARAGEGVLARADEDAAPALLIHPGSGGREKCWPIERFLALADSLAPLRTAWMLGPAELERYPELRPRLERQSRGVIMEPDLGRAAQAIAGAAAFLGNDSGITHLAAALGVPTVVLFGPTDPQIWRPLGEHVDVVATPRPGQAMDAIDPAAVRASVLRASRRR